MVLFEAVEAGLLVGESGAEPCVDIIVVFRRLKAHFCVVSVRNDAGEEVDGVVEEIEAVVECGGEVVPGGFGGSGGRDVVGEGASRVGLGDGVLDRAVEQSLFVSRESDGIFE